LALVTINETLI